MKTTDTGRLTKKEKAQLQQKFQTNLSLWRATKSPEYWDNLFVQVSDCANHLLSKMAPMREDRYDIAEEATINFMQKLLYGVKEGAGRRGKNTVLKVWTPESLPTMLRFEVIHLLYNEQQKFEDAMTSLEEYQENLLKEGK